MDDSTDSFACSSDTNDYSNSAFTSDTNDLCSSDTNAYCNTAFTSDANDLGNSAITSATNAYCNAAFTSDANGSSNSAITSDSNAHCNPVFKCDTNDNCNIVDKISTVDTQNDTNKHRDTYSNSFPSETSHARSNINDNSFKIHTQNESDGDCQQSAAIRHCSFEEDPKNYASIHSKENDYTSINTLNASEDCHNGKNEGYIAHKIYNDKNRDNAKDSKEEKIKEYCYNNDEMCSEHKQKSQSNQQTDQLNLNYELTSTFDARDISDRGLRQTENEETDTKTSLEYYNNNKYLKDSQLNFKKVGPSETNIVKDPVQSERCAPHWKQFLAAMGPYLMIFSGGLSCGFSATLLPQLKQEQSAILVNDSSPSWIASMAALPMAPGCFIGGWIIEKWGRRYALRVLSLPFFLGWVLIATAPNLSLMLMGRFLNGISIGMLAPPMSVFISETSHPKLRGMFLAFLSFSLAVGIFVAHLIGTWVPWNWTAAICSVFPLISAGFLTFVPESPMWLLSKGRIEEASNSFHWLRGNKDEVVTELKGMIEKFDSANTSPLESWKEKLKTFHSPEFFKPLVIMIIIYATCQFSGVHTITFYSVTIIEIAVGKGINKYMAMLTIDFLRILTTLLTIMTSRKFPRRSLCIVSGVLTSVSMMSLAVFLYFYKEIPETLTMVPLCFLSAYIIAINIGLMPLPWIIVGEIFPARVRSFGAGLASAIGYCSTFIVVKTAPGMMVDIGQVATFMFYGSVALVGTGVLYFVLPETKGRSMVEIEALFKRNKIKNNP